MKRLITILFLLFSLSALPQVTALNGSMNGATIRATINNNCTYLSNYNIGTDTIVKVASGMTYRNYVGAINRIFRSITTQMGRGDTIVTFLNTYDKGTLMSRINSNFQTLYDSTIAYDYILTSKIPTIPGKGTAIILSQNADWKLSYYPTQDTLYLSNDGGDTYFKKKYVASLDNVRMAYVFDNGNVIFSYKNNTMYHSTDSLTTISQIYVQENGSNMVFHTPQNASYPGNYFTTIGGIRSFHIGSTEVLLWGVYVAYSTATEMNGAVPVNAYYSSDKGQTVKVAYRFGGNRPVSYDNGTASGAMTGGTYIGHATNMATTHIHGVSFIPADTAFLMAHGEAGDISYFKYNVSGDSWTMTKKNGNQALRTINYAFDGDSLIWYSDGDSSIYKGLYADVKNNVSSYRELAYTKSLGLNMSEYGQAMFSLPFQVNYITQQASFYISSNSGQTWKPLARAYLHALTTGNYINYSLNYILNGNVDSDGYYCVQRMISSSSSIWFNSGHKSLQMKIFKKPGAN